MYLMFQHMTDIKVCIHVCVLYMIVYLMFQHIKVYIYVCTCVCMIYNYVLNVSTYTMYDGYKGMYTCVCIIYT